MQVNHSYSLPTVVELFCVGDNEAAAYSRWSALAGSIIRQAEEVYTILEPGRRNGGPGPDFLRARIQFPDGIIKVGDVEIHCRTGGWYQHGHRWDGRYSNVILHIITGGTATPITLGAHQHVPTLYLPDHLPHAKACESYCSTPLDQAIVEQMIDLLAAQRWYRKIARFTGSDPTQQQRELALKLTCGSGADQLVQIWREELIGAPSLVDFVTRVIDRGPDKLGSRGKYAGRLAATAILVWLHENDCEKLWALTFSDFWSMLDEFATADLPIASRQFVIELVGNWLLPLSEIETGRDCYEGWFNLPRGWLYGRVKAFLPKINRIAPKLFGEQQGLLEWEESLCNMNDCTACPVVSS